jgi:cytochrome c551/c552
MACKFIVVSKAGATKATVPILALAEALAVGPVQARSGTEVLEAKGYLNCHAMDKAKTGPAFKDVAVKCKGKPGAFRPVEAKSDQRSD